MAATDPADSDIAGNGPSPMRWFERVHLLWRRTWRRVSHFMPKGLYARSLIIVIAPMILLQSVVAFVFMERHWQLVTQRLSMAVTRDIAAIIDMIETYPDEDYSEVTVRPNAFTRLLSNLVGNALRYATNVTLTANHTRGSLIVIVDDDGPGIPADSRDEVFKPFVRLDAARNQDAGGTGLGLAIARDIARSHGGDIMLEDSPMGGLRAIVRVPA